MLDNFLHEQCPILLQVKLHWCHCWSNKKPSKHGIKNFQTGKCIEFSQDLPDTCDMVLAVSQQLNIMLKSYIIGAIHRARQH